MQDFMTILHIICARFGQPSAINITFSGLFISIDIIIMSICHTDHIQTTPYILPRMLRPYATQYAPHSLHTPHNPCN